MPARILAEDTKAPAAEPHFSAHLLHLDQFVWVELAKAKKSMAGKYWNAYQRLGETSGKVQVALSSGNYLELWNRRGHESRRDVARVMRDLTGYVTLRAVHEVQAEEVRRAARRLEGIYQPEIERTFILGVGANHAFGTQTGRFRFVESLADEHGDEGNETAVPEWVEVLRDREDQGPWEWVNLLGVDDSYDLEGVEYRPEHRLGDYFAGIRNQIDRIVKSANSDPSLLYRLLVARELEAIGELIAAEMSDAEIIQRFTGPAAGIAFVGDVPTANVKVEIEYRTLRNSTYLFKQHDRTDIHEMALAMPYCDAIWTDKHWTHVARAAGLEDTFRARLISSADDLLQLLDDLDAPPLS